MKYTILITNFNVLLQKIISVFRWDIPTSPNGVVLKYQISCWIEGTDQECEDTELPPSSLEYVVPDLPQNSTIYFKVIVSINLKKSYRM